MDEGTTSASAVNKDEQDKKTAKDVMARAAALVRASNGLPRSGDDYELCNSYSAFSQLMKHQETRIHSLLTKAMAVSGCPVRPPRADGDLDDYVDRIIRANDSLVERAGVLMDELERAGRDEEVKVPKTIVGAESTKRKDPATTRPLGAAPVLNVSVMSSLAARLKTAHEEQLAARVAFTGPKPQKQWNLSAHIDNGNGPFKSKLHVKHHARAGKQGAITISDTDGDRSRWASDEYECGHPYRVELDHFTPLDKQMEPAEAKKYGEIESTKPILVNTLESLQKLCKELNALDEFAIDLEHHDSRTFLGLTCLMQISSRHADYIVDPFPIWEHMHLLNEPFTNPAILKVFHGAASDIHWLQRDFGVHVVNMFDTYHAMRRLDMPKFSLQFLVNKYCSVMLNKQMQTSDWRIRPLTEEQLAYARCDTHYLLYCYDELRNALLEKGNELKNLLTAVYSDSRLVCASEYKKPVFDPMGYEALLAGRRNFNSQQVYALSQLWRWRDEVARREDEGLAFVLPNHMMLHIAEALPREMQGIIACCSPVPVMVKEHLLELHRIVYAARDQPLQSFTIQKAAQGVERSIMESLIDQQNRMTRVKALLRCKLDFSHSRFDEEIGRGPRTIVDSTDDIIVAKESDTFLGVLGEDVQSAGFGTISTAVDYTIEKEKLAKIMRSMEQWATPYECYSIAVKEAAKQEAIRQEEEKKRRELAGDSGVKKMFSHHDATVCRKPDFSNKVKINENNIMLSECAADATRFTDDQILSKEALKRKRKAARNGATISTEVGSLIKKKARAAERDRDAEEEEEEDSDSESSVDEGDGEGEEMASYSKRSKQEPADGGSAASQFDYEQYDKKMFHQKPKAQDDFDPFHQKFRVNKKKGGRGGQKRARGGLHRMGTQSTGFNPGAKK